MAGDELSGVAEQLATILGDSCLLVGGLAVSAWGHVRATEDVDFVCNLEPEEIQARLAAEGIPSQLRKGDVLEGDIAWVINGVLSSIPFQIIPPMVPLDWDGAMRIPMPDGAELDVVGLDDLLHLKLKAGSVRGLWDVAILVQRHPDRLEKARALAESCGVLDELDRWLSDPRLKSS